LWWRKSQRRELTYVFAEEPFRIMATQLLTSYTVGWKGCISINSVMAIHDRNAEM
jgi:hypothetical protein